MARFANLFQVAQVLADVIDTAVSTTPEIRVASPLENPDSTTEAVRITLLWTTPQSTHRSDPAERNPDGTVLQPMVTVSAAFLITTYGSTDQGNLVQAYGLLGEIMHGFHTQPTLTLPLSGLGDGRLNLVQVPVDADLTEKIYTSLHVRNRPWVLYDVGPIQLQRTAVATDQPIVHPGGVRMPPIQVIARPTIERITPNPVGAGGRVRLDGSYTSPVTRVVIGTTRVEGGGLAVPVPEGPVLATLTNAIQETAHDVTLTAGGSTSASSTLTVVSPNTPSIDAPADIRHPLANNLTLTGRALGNGPVELILWPDQGVSMPSDVRTIPGVAAGGGTTITVNAADLATLGQTTYRISLHFDTHGFTPYVLLEFTP